MYIYIHSQDFIKLLEIEVYNLLIRIIIAALLLSHRLNTRIITQTRTLENGKSPSNWESETSINCSPGKVGRVILQLK